MVSFDVVLNGKIIDTVFYSDSFLVGYKTLSEAKEDVKKSLIEHDGYNPNITIK